MSRVNGLGLPLLIGKMIKIEANLGSVTCQRDVLVDALLVIAGGTYDKTGVKRKLDLMKAEAPGLKKARVGENKRRGTRGGKKQKTAKLGETNGGNIHYNNLLIKFIPLTAVPSYQRLKVDYHIHHFDYSEYWW